MTSWAESGLLAEVTRGGRVESRHVGRAVVVDASGRVVWSCGDVEAPFFPRSTVKALLALELVASGAADRLGLGDDALALACSSHGGEKEHVALASAMLASVGRGPSALECGAHWPSYEPAARDWRACDHGEPTALHNTCSGKHAGMICLACDQGLDPAGYTAPEHDVQRRLTALLESVTGAVHTPENRGIDGCSVPTYAIPMRALAHGLARFGTGVGLSAGYAGAAARLRRAIAAHPFLMAGTARYDTAVMTQFGMRAFVKMGAEGVMVASLAEEGLGIVVKADDGANRAAEMALSALLSHFGQNSLLRNAGDEAFLQTLLCQELKNWRGLHVGEAKAALLPSLTRAC